MIFVQPTQRLHGRNCVRLSKQLRPYAPGVTERLEAVKADLLDYNTDQPDELALPAAPRN